MKKYYQLGDSVTISGSVFIGNYQSYAGTYSSSNRTSDQTYSYYLGGDSSRMDVPHFTTGNTNGGQADFVSFHITLYYNRLNIGVWYNWNRVSTDITRGDINYNNVPSSQLVRAQAWVDAQLPVLDQMAIQFWDQLDPPTLQQTSEGATAQA